MLNMRGRCRLSLAVALVLSISGPGALILSTAPPASAQPLVGSTVQPLAFGDASTYGQVALRAQAEFVGMAAPPDSAGYWLGALDGGVFAYGDAGFYGSAGALGLNHRSSGWPPHPTGAATGWSPPTAGSSPTATPASTARPVRSARRAGRRHRRDTRWEGLLAGRLRRRDLRLRRRRLLRKRRRGGSVRIHRDGRRRRRARLLAGECRGAGRDLRRRPELRVGTERPARLLRRRDRRIARFRRLLVGGHGRWRVRLR